VYVDLLDSLSENIDLQLNNNGSYIVYFEGSPTYDICIGRNGEECMPSLVESLVSQSCNPLHKLGGDETLMLHVDQ
jgi:hypothetical protein